MKKTIPHTLRGVADRILFGRKRRPGMIRLLVSMPISAPLIILAAILEK